MNNFLKFDFLCRRRNSSSKKRQNIAATLIQKAQTFQQKMLSVLRIYCLIQSQMNRSQKELQGNGFKIMKEPFPHVLIQSQRLLPEVFLKDIQYLKDLGLGNLVERWLGDCLGCTNTTDPAWSQLKRIFLPVFNVSERDYDSLMLEWDGEIWRLMQQSQATEKPVSVEKVVADLPLTFVLRRIFGASFLNQYKETFQMLEENSAFLVLKINKPDKISKWFFYRFLPTQTNFVLKNFQLNWEMILETAAVSQDVKREGIYHQLVENYQNSQGVTFKMFSETLAEIIFTNKDIAVPTAAWLLTHYSLYPSVTDPSLFIEESARLAPVLPTSFAKRTTKDHVLDNMKIPKGTIVFMDFIALGRSADWNMSDLETFRPERFNEIKKEVFVNRFGYGGRKCAGSRIATTLLKQMLEHLQKNWLLRPSQPTKLDSIKQDPLHPLNMPLFEVWIEKLGPSGDCVDCL